MSEILHFWSCTTVFKIDEQKLAKRRIIDNSKDKNLLWIHKIIKSTNKIIYLIYQIHILIKQFQVLKLIKMSW